MPVALRWSPPAGPRKFTVEAGKSLTASWDLPAAPAGYDLHLHGPNGFVQQFQGDAASAGVTVAVTEGNDDVTFALSVPAAGKATTFTLTDNAYGAGGPWTVPVSAGSTGHQSVSVAHSGHWYDVSVTSAFDAESLAGGGDGTFEALRQTHDLVAW